jgi:hypothetical protein
MNIAELLREKSGIKLDIACGANKQGPDWIGLDIQALPGVDIVHDLNRHPWPLPDECALTAIASHIAEHIPTVAWSDKRGTWYPFLEFMDEVWRVMKPDGQFAVVAPHGASEGYLQDPTHAHPFNQNMWLYFDPLTVGGELYKFYRPKPWKVQLDVLNQPSLYWDPSGNIEVVLIKRREDRSYYE